MTVNTTNINTKIGFNLDAKTMAELLTKMSLEATLIDDVTLKVPF